MMLPTQNEWVSSCDEEDFDFLNWSGLNMSNSLITSLADTKVREDSDIKNSPKDPQMVEPRLITPGLIPDCPTDALSFDEREIRHDVPVAASVFQPLFNVESRDVLLIGQFCEIVGPRYDYALLPDGTTLSFTDFVRRLRNPVRDQEELSNLVVRLLSTDQQFRGQEFYHTPPCTAHTILEDAVSLTAASSTKSGSETVKLHAFVFYFLLHDMDARGYIRNVILVYLTRDVSKLYEHYSLISSVFDRTMATLMSTHRRHFLCHAQKRLKLYTSALEPYALSPHEYSAGVSTMNSSVFSATESGQNVVPNVQHTNETQNQCANEMEPEKPPKSLSSGDTGPSQGETCRDKFSDSWVYVPSPSKLRSTCPTNIQKDPDVQTSSMESDSTVHESPHEDQRMKEESTSVGTKQREKVLDPKKYPLQSKIRLMKLEIEHLRSVCEMLHQGSRSSSSDTAPMYETYVAASMLDQTAGTQDTASQSSEATVPSPTARMQQEGAVSHTGYIAPSTPLKNSLESNDEPLSPLSIIHKEKKSTGILIDTTGPPGVWASALLELSAFVKIFNRSCFRLSMLRSNMIWFLSKHAERGAIGRHCESLCFTNLPADYFEEWIVDEKEVIMGGEGVCDEGLWEGFEFGNDQSKSISEDISIKTHLHDNAELSTVQKKGCQVRRLWIGGRPIVKVPIFHDQESNSQPDACTDCKDGDHDMSPAPTQPSSRVSKFGSAKSSTRDNPSHSSPVSILHMWKALDHAALDLIATFLLGYPLLVYIQPSDASPVPQPADSESNQLERSAQPAMPMDATVSSWFDFLCSFIPGRRCVRNEYDSFRADSDEVILPEKPPLRTDGLYVCASVGNGMSDAQKSGIPQSSHPKITKEHFQRYAFVLTDSIEQFQAADVPSGVSILELRTNAFSFSGSGDVDQDASLSLPRFHLPSASFFGLRYHGILLQSMRCNLDLSLEWPSERSLSLHLDAVLFDIGMELVRSELSRISYLSSSSSTKEGVQNTHPMSNMPHKPSLETEDSSSSRSSFMSEGPSTPSDPSLSVEPFSSFARQTSRSLGPIDAAILQHLRTVLISRDNTLSTAGMATGSVAKREIPVSSVSRTVVEHAQLNGPRRNVKHNTSNFFALDHPGGKVHKSSAISLSDPDCKNSRSDKKGKRELVLTDFI